MYDAVIYRSSEHAFVAAKTLDLGERKLVFNTQTPGQVKRLGRQLSLRPDWNDIRTRIMYTIVNDKFHRTPELAELLLSTSNHALIEGNTWNDQFWGQCNGKGANWLGRILMDIRSKLS
jgi:hypothetical protein